MLKMDYLGSQRTRTDTDGIDPACLTSSSKAEPQAEATKEEGGQEDKYEKYRKMLKMGLPQQAVENKMIQDGIDPAASLRLEGRASS